MASSKLHPALAASAAKHFKPGNTNTQRLAYKNNKENSQIDNISSQR